MKKEYELRGIDCGNCAAKIERAVNQLEQVESATVNLIAQKLILETKSEDGIDKEIIDLESKLSVRKRKRHFQKNEIGRKSCYLLL